jgi:uncharacterized membrane protein YidH (DUF202 family)
MNWIRTLMALVAFGIAAAVVVLAMLFVDSPADASDVIRAIAAVARL